MKTAKWIAIVLVIGALCAVCSYAAWSWRGTHDAKTTTDAINTAYADARNQVAQEHKLFEQYTALADRHFARLEGQIAALTLQGVQRHDSIVHEVQTTPFYQQPLPDTGYALWLAARSSFASHSSSSASAPWSPASGSAAAPVPSSSARTSAPATKPGSR